MGSYADRRQHDENVETHADAVGEPRSGAADAADTATRPFRGREHAARTGGAVVSRFMDSSPDANPFARSFLPNLGVADEEGLLDTDLLAEIRVPLPGDNFRILSSTKKLIEEHLAGRGADALDLRSEIRILFGVANLDDRTAVMVAEFATALVEFLGLPEGTEPLSRVYSLNERISLLSEQDRRLFEGVGL